MPAAHHVGMTASQRWCIWLGLLASIALYLVPPWRYRIAAELRGPDYIILAGREAHDYALRSTPPQYYHAWQRGSETGIEHGEDQQIDRLRLALSWLSVATVVIIVVRGPHDHARSALLRYAVITVLAGAAKWAVLDTALILIRPRVEQYLMVASVEERIARGTESFLAATLRLGLIR